MWILIPVNCTAGLVFSSYIVTQIIFSENCCVIVKSSRIKYLCSSFQVQYISFGNEKYLANLKKKVDSLMSYSSDIKYLRKVNILANGNVCVTRIIQWIKASVCVHYLGMCYFNILHWLKQIFVCLCHSPLSSQIIFLILPSISMFLQLHSLIYLSLCPTSFPRWTV